LLSARKTEFWEIAPYPIQSEVAENPTSQEPDFIESTYAYDTFESATKTTLQRNERFNFGLTLVEAGLWSELD
jgi:hypothetical protein